ncbi:bis(5'-nucleosyl)-tetraphosphatase (symmetrical) YqeK [Frisingicoccus sp.]|uniref:bis(5'-nucleosyl)-tetraphosphatase (symmetrical) YqeK n=1 Tax=Frisingicoccus sp. TaxID=1918627 RepID=UPI003AB2217F
MRSSIEDIQNKLRKNLKGSRFIHTLGVEYTSVCLAMKYEEDLEKAELAGLLHDCAKELPEKKMIKICRNHGEKISKMEFEQPFLLHGKAGACIAKDKFGIEDEVILNAIRYHTTGRPAMTLLEKIVFVADYIEPNRKKADRLPELRRLAFENLDEAVLQILEQTLDYLEKTGKQIDRHTMITRDYYKKLLRSSE